MTQRRREMDLCDQLKIVLDTDSNKVNDKGQIDGIAAGDPAAAISPASENCGKAPGA